MAKKRRKTIKRLKGSPQKGVLKKDPFQQAWSIQRDIYNITNPHRWVLNRLQRKVIKNLDEIQDRRRRPEDLNRQIDGRPARIRYFNKKIKPRRKISYYVYRAKFINPKKVIACSRRRTRRKVLFALRLTGKGSGAARRKFIPESKVRC